jgi:predicted esterase
MDATGLLLPRMRLAGLCGVLLGAAFYGTAPAVEVVLKDGRLLSGAAATVASLADQPGAADPEGVGPLQLILVLDDDLRRTFISKRLIQDIRQANVDQMVDEEFHVHQRVMRAGRTVKSVGPAMRISPFDEYGRRIFTFNTPAGPVDVIQGITLITPRWTKVEGITHIWDMRIATSAIPRDTLHKILLKQVDPDNIEHRKKIARFYLQSERYKEARAELQAVVAAHPNRADVKEQLEPTIRRIRQMEAGTLLKELELRREAGQHRFAYAMLQKFPSEGVADEALMAARAVLQEYEELQARAKETFQRFDALLGQVNDPKLRAKLAPMRDEIFARLNINTLGRMAAFRQHADDPQLPPENKLAFALSGWLLGSDAALQNISVTTSLYRVRDLVRQYLNEPVKLNRARILDQLKSEEGAVPQYVAALVANMEPPGEVPGPESDKHPGYYRLQSPGLPKEPPVTYYVQLPPEYDPYRRYPTVVTLQGAGTTAEHQVDWWAGAWADGGWRTGQAARYGYIVIAPQWTKEHQQTYDYSARAHAAVLGSLRHACKRFAIDTDRVFLSGHSIGGDAAWDIGLAHPDLWAGVIPMVARSDRYCSLYWENAEHLPFYVVAGEMDGSSMTDNARDLDRYLKRGYDCTVVEYLGRGHEHFHDEVLRVFDWMGRFRRNFYPREFDCASMRPWDNFFWWLELKGMPPGSTVVPVDWPPPRGTQPARVKGRVTNTNGLNVQTGTSHVTVWISPRLVDFSQRMIVVVNSQRLNGRDQFIEPDLETLLEDVRTRGDRQNPFWAKVEGQTGRVYGAR